MLNHAKSGPTGFSIDNYKNVETFDAFEWAQQILYRLNIEKIIDNKISIKNEEYRNSCREKLPSTMKTLIANPIGRVGFQMHILTDKADRIDQLGRENSVTELTMSQLFCLHEDAVSKGHSQFPSRDERAGLSNEEQETILRKMDESANSLYEGRRRFAHVTIDLSVSNQHIVQNFARWLGSVRKSEKPIIYTSEKLSSWHRHKVLPYADLKLWEKWTGNKLSEVDLTELLKLEEIQIEKPLKQTKKYFKEIMTKEAAFTLYFGFQKNQLTPFCGPRQPPE